MGTKALLNINNKKQMVQFDGYPERLLPILNTHFIGGNEEQLIGDGKFMLRSIRVPDLFNNVEFGKTPRIDDYLNNWLVDFTYTYLPDSKIWIVRNN